METVRRFRSWVVRLALAFTAASAGVAYPWNAVLAKGLLLGGIASILGFWLVTRNAEVANPPEDGVKSRPRKWLSIRAAARMAVYALALIVARNLDPLHLYGFFGAAAGLMVVRVAVAVVGVTGWDLKHTGS